MPWACGNLCTAPGLLYGLRRNTYIDDRMNTEKSTHAAAQHLNHLYEYFGDWHLVVAAYNCGQGRMDRAIARSKTRDFWEISALPRETRNHVPKFMAAVIIAKDPAFFGFKDIVYQPRMSYDKVALTEPVNLRLAAECAGTTYTYLRYLNPELRRPYTPPAMRRNAYNLRVPKGAGAKFRANYAQIPEHKKIQLIDYVVKTRRHLIGHCIPRGGVGIRPASGQWHHQSSPPANRPETQHSNVSQHPTPVCCNTGAPGTTNKKY